MAGSKRRTWPLFLKVLKAFQMFDSCPECFKLHTSSANIPDVSKRTRSEEERAISRRKKSKDKCLIYVKPKEDAIFTPIFLQHKTVKEFKDKLEFKFGAYKFQSTRIGRIYQVGEIRVFCTESFP